MKRRLIFTGGGTAGHVYPGLSVIESLRKKDKDLEILWIGSSRGMEGAIVEAAGVDFRGVPSGKLRRYFSLHNITDLFKIAAGFINAFFLIKRYKPHLVFSKGGFVSVPPVAAAGLQKIPVFSHESDVTPGLATRINTRFSKQIFTSYEKTLRFLPEGRAVLTGNPVRAAIFAADAEKGRMLLGAGERRIIMVLGGSQGALQINRLIEELLPELTEHFFVMHQSGKHDFKPAIPKNYRREEFIGEELPHFMAAADLIISRAGASSLWETAALGKPSILIPLGSAASRGDQQLNAEIFQEAGASIVLAGEIRAVELLSEISALMDDDEKRKNMSRAALSLVNGNPADLIADYILKGLE